MVKKKEKSEQEVSMEWGKKEIIENIKKRNKNSKKRKNMLEKEKDKRKKRKRKRIERNKREIKSASYTEHFQIIKKCNSCKQ